MNNYRYELKYICDGIETVITSPADIDIYQMKELLKQLCKCAGWSDNSIYTIFNSLSDDDVDSD